ncbi:MAG TPA: hypothetical protein VN408_14575, partial [Actinoplanes sp.]|nr:hypothetical protein [Actinoplanes sp.]
MTTYHPDPELLDALATVWDNKATELETLATTSHAGFAADTSTMVWRGNAKNEAYETSVAISNSVKKTATACREFAKSLREMADEVRKKLAELAKQELKAFLMAIVGLILGIAVGFALGPLISSMAAWLAGALALASEIATLVATLTFEFVIGSLVYGALQFGMDMAFEGIAAAATGTEFHIEGNAWQSVLIGGLTGGLFSLNPAKIGALHKNIWKTGGPSVTPPKVDPAPAPVTNSTPGGGTFTPVDRPGGGIGLSSADDIRIDVGGAGGPGTIPKLGPETPGVGAPGVRPGGGVVPEPPPAISASSFNRTDPAGGGLGTPGVGNTSRPLPPPGTENALLRPPPARPGSVDAPGVVTGPQGPPRVNLDRPVAPGGENITPPVVRGESGAPANTGGTPVTQRPTPPPATPETATAPPTPAPGGRP